MNPFSFISRLTDHKVNKKKTVTLIHKPLALEYEWSVTIAASFLPKYADSKSGFSSTGQHQETQIDG